MVNHKGDFGMIAGRGADVFGRAGPSTILLADSETRIVYRQPPDQASALGELLGLTAEETATVQRLIPGQALWRVGGRSTLVEHIVIDIERPLIDINAAMGGRNVQ